MYLYVARHGETVWNTEKRMQGPIVMKAIISIVENTELRDFWNGAFIKPASLSIFEYKSGSWTTCLCGDISHFEC